MAKTRSMLVTLGGAALLFFYSAGIYLVGVSRGKGFLNASGSPVSERHSMDSRSETLLNYGQPIGTEVDLMFCWRQFAHEFDWRILGPGRFRSPAGIDNETEGVDSPTWSQLIVPHVAESHIVAREMTSWRELVSYSGMNPDEAIPELLEFWDYGPGELRKLRGNELDMIPFILAEVLGNLGVTCAVGSSAREISEFATGDAIRVLAEGYLAS